MRELFQFVYTSPVMDRPVLNATARIKLDNVFYVLTESLALARASDDGVRDEFDCVTRPCPA